MLWHSITFNCTCLNILIWNKAINQTKMIQKLTNRLCCAISYVLFFCCSFVCLSLVRKTALISQRYDFNYNAANIPINTSWIIVLLTLLVSRSSFHGYLFARIYYKSCLLCEAIRTSIEFCLRTFKDTNRLMTLLKFMESDKH